MKTAGNANEKEENATCFTLPKTCGSGFLPTEAVVGQGVAFSKETSEPGRVKREGAVFYVRYRDHVHFENVDPEAYTQPLILEAVGWLAFEDELCIQLVFERLVPPTPKGARIRTGGLVILKSSILELREVSL